MSCGPEPDDFYVTENSRCSGCGHWFDESELETLGFVVEESGVQPGTVHGGKTYHVDHVIPLSRGGSNGPENIVIACPHCNESKGAKLPHEWPQGSRLL